MHLQKPLKRFGVAAADDGRRLIDGRDLRAINSQDRIAFRRQNIRFTFHANNLVSYPTAVEIVELMPQLNGRADRRGRGRAESRLSRAGWERPLWGWGWPDRD